MCHHVVVMSRFDVEHYICSKCSSSFNYAAINIATKNFTLPAKKNKDMGCCFSCCCCKIRMLPTSHAAYSWRLGRDFKIPKIDAAGVVHVTRL